MMKEQLKAFLTLEGYTAVVSNLPEFLVFLKKEYRHVSVIYIMDVDKENFYTQERYDSVYNSACNLLQKNGIEEMHIMTIIISDNPSRVSEICKHDKYAWILNPQTLELIIGEDKVEDFYGLKAMLEVFLRQPEAASQQIREAKELVLSELKEQEKKLLKSIYVPWVAYSLVALNIVVYIVCTSLGEVVYNIGGLSVATVLGDGQWYRLITGMFLHYDLSHVFNNMLILYLLGNMIEKRLGRWQFALTYLSCGVFAGLVSLGIMYMRDADAVSLSTSGAVYGIFGLALVMEFTTIHWRRISFRTISRVILILLCIVVSVYVDSQIPGNNYEAHVGGLCLGAMIGMAWYFKQLRKTREKRYEN